MTQMEQRDKERQEWNNFVAFHPVERFDRKESKPELTEQQVRHLESIGMKVI